MAGLTTGTSAQLLSESEQPGAFRARLDLAIAGDMSALGELFAEFGALVHRSAYRLTRSRPDAEDVTQEVFVKLAAALRGFTGTSTTFPSWLRRVTVRQALMHLRGGRRRREVDVDSIATLFAPTDSSLERVTIAAALDRISDEHRSVFLLKEVEGYDHTEIADLLGISVSNSEVRLHRARRQLRDLLRGSRG